jgi:hypothetical protein
MKTPLLITPVCPSHLFSLSPFPASASSNFLPFGEFFPVYNNNNNNRIEFALKFMILVLQVFTT